MSHSDDNPPTHQPSHRVTGALTQYRQLLGRYRESLLAMRETVFLLSQTAQTIDEAIGAVEFELKVLQQSATGPCKD